MFLIQFIKGGALEPKQLEIHKAELAEQCYVYRPARMKLCIDQTSKTICLYVFSQSKPSCSLYCSSKAYLLMQYNADPMVFESVVVQSCLLVVLYNKTKPNL